MATPSRCPIAVDQKLGPFHLSANFCWARSSETIASCRQIKSKCSRRDNSESKSTLSALRPRTFKVTTLKGKARGGSPQSLISFQS